MQKCGERWPLSMRKVREKLEEVIFELSPPPPTHTHRSGEFSTQRKQPLCTHKMLPAISVNRMLTSIPVNRECCLPSGP